MLAPGPKFAHFVHATHVLTEDFHDLAGSVVSPQQSVQPLCYLSFDLGRLDPIQQVHLNQGIINTKAKNHVWGEMCGQKQKH